MIQSNVAVGVNFLLVKESMYPQVPQYVSVNLTTMTQASTMFKKVFWEFHVEIINCNIVYKFSTHVLSHILPHIY